MLSLYADNAQVKKKNKNRMLSWIERKIISVKYIDEGHTL